MFLSNSLSYCATQTCSNSIKKAVWCYYRLPTLKHEVVNVTNQWAGLCFCSCVCKLHRPPALIFELSLDEKQKFKLLWPYQRSVHVHA